MSAVSKLSLRRAGAVLSITFAGLPVLVATADDPLGRRRRATRPLGTGGDEVPAGAARLLGQVLAAELAHR